MSDTHAALQDPHSPTAAEPPPDRAPYEALITAVLAWRKPNLTPCDYEQIVLQLTGHARAVAAAIQRRAAALPKDDGRGALAEIVLREATARLTAPIEGTARCVQDRARLVRALYERLDRLTEPFPPIRSAVRSASGRDDRQK
ncbi:restriction endonuclease [Streptomyces sp. NPDC102473]|uniref:restriction endonuclease n=1 Tax=Streptomyces sp. NPDC102473 TaxID=3366180 RepID=UPI0037F15121